MPTGHGDYPAEYSPQAEGHRIVRNHLRVQIFGYIQLFGRFDHEEVVQTSVNGVSESGDNT